ncbi:MAG: hypothetical protein PWR02_1486 [Synergistales bacterium]|nr:hypothetical protein [Synergistales bacterium]MDN5336460.1 hypothetical protein [Synergistales bacterium]
MKFISVSMCAVLFLAVITKPAAAHGWPGMMPWPWMGPLMWIFWLLVIVIGLSFVMKKHKVPDSDPDLPMEIIKQRLANGEITEEEFERLRKKIES